MTIKINTALQNSMAENLAIALGNTTAELRIYTGSPPANANTAASGTLLVTIQITNDWAAAASGVKALVASESAIAGNTGTAGWARLRDAADTIRIDGSVGTSGTDFIIDNTAISNLGTVTLTAATLTQPAS
jgi:hypothetical protein